MLYCTVQCTVHSTATLTAGESKREENRSESGPGGTTQCLMIFKTHAKAVLTAQIFQFISVNIPSIPYFEGLSI